MSNDSTYQVPVDVTVIGDQTYIDLSKNELKSLHDRVFSATVKSESAVQMYVKLELAYIPFALFIIIMVTAVNIRWNRAFKRINGVWDKVDQTEDRVEKLGMLKAQKINLWDRLFIYIIFLVCSLYLDTQLMSVGLFQFPWLSIPTSLFVIVKVLKRISSASYIKGFSDDDLVTHFDEVLKKMIIDPIISGIQTKISGLLISNKEKGL